MTYTHYQENSKSIFCVDMREEEHKPWSELAIKGIEKFLNAGKNIAILVSKKGYASGTICNECGHIPRCDYCDIAVAVHHTHDNNPIGLCHICRREYPVSAECQKCHSTDTQIYGLGAQQVVEWISERYGVTPLLIEQSTAKTRKKITALHDSFAKTQVVVATSLISTGIDGWKPDLFVIVNADAGLHIPDYQASWNNFCLLYDCFQHFDAEHFIVQSYNPDAESIRFASMGDYAAMQLHEDTYRKQFSYPPYATMCVIHYKHEIEERLHSSTNKLFQELLYLKQTYSMDSLAIYTTPPMVYKMYGKFRFTIILKGAELRQFMDIAYSKLRMQSRGFKVDREPQQLL